jgi:hypothetical protein
VTPRLVALLQAEQRLLERLAKIEAQLDASDPAGWIEYSTLATALATIELRPEVLAPVLTQRELAARLGVSERTVRRRARRGDFPSKRAAR